MALGVLTDPFDLHTEAEALSRIEAALRGQLAGCVRSDRERTPSRPIRRTRQAGLISRRGRALFVRLGSTTP
eukprot:9502436-Pyramimonas_sp.AAC.1